MVVKVSFKMTKKYSGGYESFTDFAYERYREWSKGNVIDDLPESTEAKSIDDIFEIPYESAREFRLFDCVYPSVVVTTDEVDLMDSILKDYVLIITNRSWINPSNLRLKCEVVKEDMIEEFMSDLFGSKF